MTLTKEEKEEISYKMLSILTSGFESHGDTLLDCKINNQVHYDCHIYCDSNGQFEISVFLDENEDENKEHQEIKIKGSIEIKFEK